MKRFEVYAVGKGWSALVFRASTLEEAYKLGDQLERDTTYAYMVREVRE